MERQVGIKAGTVVQLSTFRENEQFPVEILSAKSIDRGATSVIYQGVLKLPETPYLVALKVFPITLDKPGEETLRRELRVVSKVSHNCVLTFIGTASLGGRTILIAPFMRNGNLLKYITDNSRVDRRRLILQVAEGVRYLHEHAGIVHGDIKCENVLVSNAGNALVADFGLSTIIEKEESSATTMTAIRACNTLRRSKTRESDVYAFGMLILQTFSETKPWPTLRNEAVLFQVVTGNLHPHPGTQSISRGFTDLWWSICTKCWTFDPMKRPDMHHIWKLIDEIYSSSSPKPGLTGMPCTVFRTAGQRHTVTSVAFTPCGSRIAYSENNGSLTLRESDGDTVLWSCLDLRAIYAVAVSPCGRQICSAGDDRTLLRRDAESGAPLGMYMTGHESPVRCLAYSPDSALIVSGGEDNQVRLWNALTGEALGDPIVEHTHWVCSVAFAPNGSTIASGSRDGKICLYDLVSETLIILQGRHGGRVLSICFSSDGIHLLSGGEDGVIRIWNATTQQLRREIHGHTDWVASVTVSPSGDYIASGSYDSTVRVWHALTGEPVCAPFTGHKDWVRSVAFSPNGRRLVSGSGDGTIRTWELVAR